MTSNPENVLLFDIQRFSIHDGPGIRTTLFFKGCPLRCVWCQNPESHQNAREMAFYRERCHRCFACQEACPEGAILQEEERRIDHRTCTVCGQCLSVCVPEALRLVGATWDGSALLDEVLKDRDFFADSGGGITLSGGEPLMQSGFLNRFLPLVRREGLHITLETCGLAPWETIESLLPCLNLIYFDLKLMDPERHRQYTGTSNEGILKNFKRLAAVFPFLEARMPVVPSINDDQENIQETARFLLENHQNRIHLLRYHSLGQAKLTRIKTELKPLQLPGDAREILEGTAKLFEKKGISVIIT